MLVVIGILTLLAGLLLPAVRGARESGWQIACSSNLRQVGQLITTYHGDFGRIAMGPVDRSTAVYWYQILADLYLDSGSPEELFRCPSHLSFAFTRDRISYGLNAEELPDIGDTDSGYPTRVNSIVGSFSSKILAGDAAGKYLYSISLGLPDQEQYMIKRVTGTAYTPGGGKAGHIVSNRHRAALGNVLHWDGAVKPRLAKQDTAAPPFNSNVNCGTKNSAPSQPADDLGDPHWRLSVDSF
jgi:hypothetical protein